MAKRERHVFPTNEIAHLWAHKVQDDARNQQGNFYFEGDTIYSYGSHFPIARHVTGKGKRQAILFTTRGYSSTTSGHKAAVRGAIPGGVKVFEVASVIGSWGTDEHATNLRAFVTDAKEALAVARRSRKHGEYELKKCFGLLATAKEYSKFFGVKFPAKEWKFLPKPKELAELRQVLAERKARAKVLDDARDARERERYRLQEIENAKREQENIAKWRTGEYYGSLYHVPAMLRISGDQVETSKGARIPLAHAVRGLRFVRAIVAKGEDWQRNGHTFHLGHYSLDKVSRDGTVTAGCHVISMEEIERIAPELERWQRENTAAVQAAEVEVKEVTGSADAGRAAR